MTVLSGILIKTASFLNDAPLNREDVFPDTPTVRKTAAAGFGGRGKTPMETFLENVPLAREKILDIKEVMALTGFKKQSV